MKMFIFEFMGGQPTLMGHFRKGGAQEGGRPPHGARRGRVGHFGPMATTPKGAGRPHPLLPFL